MRNPKYTFRYAEIENWVKIAHIETSYLATQKIRNMKEKKWSRLEIDKK